MKILALTGGIATGKSTVAKMFRQLGAVVLEADRLAHQVYRPGTSVYRDIRRRYGTTVVGPSGRIDRKKLAQILFSSPREKKWLERRIHPATFKLIGEKIRRALRRRPRLLLVEAALHFETGYYRLFPATLVVSAKPAVQIQRLVRREGLTPTEARRRLKSQWPGAKKIAMADYVIDNSAGLGKTRAQVRHLFKDWTGKKAGAKNRFPRGSARAGARAKGSG